MLPPAVAAEVELSSLMLRACPFTDDDDLLPICYRCQATNALLNTQVGCSHLAPLVCTKLQTAFDGLLSLNVTSGCVALLCVCVC